MCLCQRPFHWPPAVVQVGCRGGTPFSRCAVLCAQKLIFGFAPELFGVPLNEDDVLDTQVAKKGQLTYYEW
jgi:hypothetical protein